MTFVIPTKSAVVIAFLIGSVSSAWLLLRFWSQVGWRTTRLLGTGIVVGAAVGVVILSVVSARSTSKLVTASLVSCVIGIALGSWICARMQTSHFIWAVDLLLLATGAMTIAKAIS
jgi:uncharacterized membrane protein YfcA